MKFFYTHRKSLDSTVLDTAYYSEPEQRLVLELRHNGVLVGYEWIPREVYLSLSQAPSPGSYWNTFVKDRFPGFSTSDIDGFAEHFSLTTDDADSKLEPDVGKEEIDFTATFETFEFDLLARDWNDALDKVNRARDLLGFTDELIKLTSYPG